MKVIWIVLNGMVLSVLVAVFTFWGRELFDVDKQVIEKPVGILVDQQGDVKMREAFGDSWLDVEDQGLFGDAYRVRTGRSGKAEIKMKSGGSLALNENSLVVLKRNEIALDGNIDLDGESAGFKGLKTKSGTIRMTTRSLDVVE